MAVSAVPGDLERRPDHHHRGRGHRPVRVTARPSPCWPATPARSGCRCRSPAYRRPRSPPVTGLLAERAGQQPARRRAGRASSPRRRRRSATSRPTPSGATATGQIDVTIEPPPSKAHPDQAPVPQEVDTQGDGGRRRRHPGPRRRRRPGRRLGHGHRRHGAARARPDRRRRPGLGLLPVVSRTRAGTDTFTYQVTDPYGLTGTATVRIAVLPPGPPQPPVAVDDVINAPPGATLHWNVLGNDFIAPGDTVTVEPLSKTNARCPPAGEPHRLLRLRPGAGSSSDPPVQFTYGDTDGGTPSLAQVIVHAVPGAQGAAGHQGRRRAAARGGRGHRDRQRAQERRRPARARPAT